MRQDQIDKILSEFKTVFPNVPVPNIIWNPRMRTTAGKVTFCRIMRQPKNIQLNPHLLKNDTDLDQTLMHELCHVADFVLYKQLGHGRTWQHCMRLVKRQPSRCHQFDTNGLKRRHKKVASMRCNCRTHEITSHRFNKVLRGARYRCGLCKSELKLVTQNETEEVAI